MNSPLKDVLKVSEVNNYIKSVFDRDPLLSEINVRGEISNYKRYPSGHHYFSLKDAEGSLRCVMFKGSAAGLKFRPENGMKVIASGRISVFPRDGQYQLYCQRMTNDGIGDLHVAFEQLKEKLFNEGLFDQSHKKPIPKYPHEIAIITSPAGAAVRDMLRIIGQRYPLAKVKVLGVRVQGEEAAAEIRGAIKYVNKFKLADVIITGRGGGSIEDLWAFNEEIVARAIFESEIPVVSAVGHEPDVTIADYAADLRASTPSNAAELVAPDIGELSVRLKQLHSAMYQSLDKQLSTYRERLESLASKRVIQSPLSYFEDKQILLDYTENKLLSAFSAIVNDKEQKFIALAASLDALSPMKVLSRGYSIALSEDGKIIKKLKDVKIGENLSLNVSDGVILAGVYGKDKST